MFVKDFNSSKCELGSKNKTENQQAQSVGLYHSHTLSLLRNVKLEDILKGLGVNGSSTETRKTKVQIAFATRNIHQASKESKASKEASSNGGTGPQNCVLLQANGFNIKLRLLNKFSTVQCSNCSLTTERFVFVSGVCDLNFHFY